MLPLSPSSSLIKNTPMPDATRFRRSGRRALLLASLTAATLPSNHALAAPPTVGNDSRSVLVNSTVTVNVLANDSDPDGDSLLIGSIGQPANGTVTLNDDNSIRYVPNTNFVGTDSFTYTVVDSNQESAVGTVVITVTDITLQSLGSGDNNESIGAAIDDLCPRLAAAGENLSDGAQQLLARCEALIEQARLDPEGVDAVLWQIAPEEISAQIRQASEFFRAQTLAVSQRQALLASGNSGFTVNGLALARHDANGNLIVGGAAGDDNTLGSRLNFFASALAGESEHDRTGLEMGYDSQSHGLTLGADYRVRNDLFVGAALSWSDSELDFIDRGGNVDASITSLIAYSVWNSGPWSLDGQLGYAALDFETTRAVTYATSTDLLAVQANGNTSGDQWSLSAQLQYELNWGALSVNPFSRLDYLTATIDAYGENNAGGWEVELGEQSREQTVLALGADTRYVQNQSWGVLIPQARLSAHSEVSGSHDTVYGRFAYDTDPANRFAISADEQDTLYFLGNVGVVAVLPRGLSGYVQYQQLFGYDDTRASQFSTGIRYEY